MKKLLALLMALVLALGGVFALAEEIALPSFTAERHWSVDRDRVNALLGMMGMNNEEAAKAVDAFVAIMGNLGSRVVFADNGLEFSVQMCGEDLFALAGELNENGLMFGTSLLSGYLLNVPMETINEYIGQFSDMIQSAQAGNEDIMASVQALMVSASGYTVDFLTEFSAAYQYGEPIQEDIDFGDGLTFNTRIPGSFDIPAALAAINGLFEKLAQDENYMSAVRALAQAMGEDMDADFTIPPIELDPETFPDITVTQYMNLDEAGEPQGTAACVAVDVLSVDGVPANCRVVLDDGVFSVTGASGDISVNFDFHLTESGAVIALAFDQAGQYVGFVITTEVGENLTFVTDVYFMDDTTPVLTQTDVYSWGGARTLPLDGAGKTLLSVEQLMNLTDDDPLASELVANAMVGWFGAIGKASTLMPDELSALMSANLYAVLGN